MAERKKTWGQRARGTGVGGGVGRKVGETEASAKPQAAAEVMTDERISAGSMLIGDSVWIAPASLRFTFSRSSGPGGQAVNKVNTRAQLRVVVNDIIGLSDRARGRLKRLAGQRLTSVGEIVIQSDVHRSQRQNRRECEDRLRDLIATALIEPKKRKKTKLSRAMIEKRLKEKKLRSERKQTRRGAIDQ